MPLTRFVLAALLLAPASVTVRAQGVFLQKEGKFLYPPNLSLGPDHLLTGMTIGSVKGYPLSATIDVENTRIDAHGQTIVVRYRSKIFRDSQGRTRLEWSITPLDAQPDPGRDMIEIYDAATRTNIHLFPATKTAAKSRFPTPEEMKKYACDPKDLPKMDPKELENLPAATKVSQIELAHDFVDGMPVRYGRESVNFARSATGKGVAYSTVTDCWFSQKLQYFVLVKRAGPGKSQHIVKLSDIRQGEPDPALFTIPPGYAISEPAPFTKDCAPKFLL